MSVAFNNVMVIDQAELAVQLHEDGVRAYQEGHIADAESFFDGALKLFEAHDGTDSPDVAAVLCDLGTLAEDRCDYKVAEQAFRRAAAIANQWQNADDEDLQRLCLRAWNDLGRVLRMQHRYQQAQQISQQALRFAEEKFDADSIEAAEALNNPGLAQKSHVSVDDFSLGDL